MNLKFINVLVVDDHAMVLEGMRALLSKIEYIHLKAIASNASSAMEALRFNAIDVAFIDINLPEVSGIELCSLIKKEFPSIHLIALSSFIQRSYVSKMLQNGASGYLAKSAGIQEIEEAIQTVLSGKLYLSKDINSLSLSDEEKNEIPTLTRREKEVLELISQGLTNKEIADKIFVSQSTVDSHRKNLLAKFKVQNAASLITIAGKMGLL
jgi:DNA-binding NarL/FixJ family response regulator